MGCRSPIIGTRSACAVTVRFLLKVLVVSAIAGGTFGYYLRELREAEADPET